MNATPRSLRVDHRVRLAAFVIAAVVALGLAACGSASSKAGADRHCSDKVAQATTSSSAVVGLWDCLDQSFQTKINEAGGTPNGQDTALSIGVALIATYLGGSVDVVTYNLTLQPTYAEQAGTKYVVLAVWLDAGGKVTNVGIGSPAF